MRKLLTILFFLLLSANAYCIYFKHIGIQKGLSHSSVLSIHQDKLGRMWFGTGEGLSIYDGIQIKTYKPNSNAYSEKFATGNLIEYITEDSLGNVFFNADFSLYRYDIFQKESSCILSNRIHAICAYKEGLLVSKNDSIYYLNTISEKLEEFCKLPYKEQYATSICIDANHNCWIGTKSGLYLKEKQLPLKCILPEHEITSLFIDSKENVWISTSKNGLFVWNKTKEIAHFTQQTGELTSNQIRSVTEDNNGHIWIGTFMGLHQYLPEENRFTVYTPNNQLGSISHSSIFPIYKDRQGTIWIGTYYGGVNYFNPEIDLFTYYSPEANNDKTINYPFVGHMVEDKDENVYICTEGGGVNFYDKKEGKFTYLIRNEHKNSIAHNNIKNIVYDDAHDKLYIGTHLGGISIYDIKKKRFSNPMLDHPNYMEAIGDRVYGMVLHEDKLIFTNNRGTWKMNIHTEQITPYFPSGKHYGFSSLLIDKEGYIWMASQKGIYRIHYNNEADQRFYKLGEKGLGSFSILSMYEDANGNIYLGSQGDGVYHYNPQSDNFTNYTTQNSNIAGNYCYAIAESPQGKIIISCNKGLSFFDTKTHTFSTMDLKNTLPISGFNEGSGLLVCHNGKIFAGNVNGLFTFYEDLFTSTTKPYRLYFSDLFVNNQFVHVNDNNRILQQAIYYTSQLNLKHNQNNLTFRFRTDNYVTPLQSPTYEYKLVGYDNEWISTTNYEIHYTNISPGNYTLKVREKGNSSVAPIEMKISVAPPFYASPISWVIYVLMTMGIIYIIFQFKQSQFRLQTSLEMEKRDKKRIEDLNQAKLQFFANISHEFRTPLTIVISQLDLLMQNEEIPSAFRNKLTKAYRNCYHLRSLVSELLDFRKLEQGHVKLKVSEYDIVPFLQDIHTRFTDYASTRSIDYQFRSEQASLVCWFDPKQLEKVIYNLLSNAFKYTKQGGSIQLAVSEEEEEIWIKVTDNGVGIQKEDIQKIFDRFYQAGNAIADIVHTPSTGIGLALVKNVMALHRGHIQVESTPGSGSCFTVCLKKGNTHFNEDELVSKSTHEELVYSSDVTYMGMNDITLLPEADNSESEPDQEQRKQILIVEDNKELLQTLANLFKPHYQVILAENGKEGLEKARTELPDIIVSDIVMPEMNGLEMCAQIKGDINCCHIPVILLTALSTIEHNITGLKFGADDYISKPFNARVLLERCNNLINSRYILQKKFQQNECGSQLLTTNVNDQHFLDNISEILEKNLDNPDFVIDEFARELGLSRTVFYSKFKALTGMTPNDFVINFKLKRATDLLQNHPELQIADITYQLGFCSPRYFSRCFKAQFNLTPSEYRKQTGTKKRTENDEIVPNADM